MDLIKTIIFIFACGALFFAAAQVQKLELYLETGHAGSVRYVGFSDDGRFLASRDMNKVAKIWDVQTGKELKSFQSSTAVISADGKTLLTAYFKVIKLLRLDTGEELISFKGHDSSINSIALSPDGKQIASASAQEIKIWDAATGKEIKATVFPKTDVNILTFSPDNQTLACTYFSSPNDLKLISVASRKEVKTFTGHSSSVISAVFSKNGQMIATGSRDFSLKIWDVQSGRMIKNIENAGDITGMAFSPDGRQLAYGDTPAHDIIVWDVASEKKIRTMEGHKGVIGALAYSSDGRIIASGSEDNGAKLWDAESGKELRNLDGRVEDINSLVFTPNGEKLFSETFNGIIKIWELNSQKELTSFSGQSGVISPDGKIFAYAANDVNDNTIQLLDQATGEQWKIASGHRNRVESISFSPNNKLLATGGIDHDIKIWDAVSRGELKTLKGHTDYVVFTQFSPDNKYLASIGDDKAIKIWSVETGKELYNLADEADNRSSLLFAVVEGNKLLLATTKDQWVKVWDVLTGKLLQAQEIPYQLNANVPYSAYELRQRVNENRRNYEPLTPAGKFKVKNGNNGKINLLEAKTDKLLASLIALGESDWIVTTPEGRFDTNKSLDKIEGLHWIVNDEILKPLPLDVFMRQYYEPRLVSRVLKCNEENNCNQEFKPLPSIADINRVQPKVAIKEIKTAVSAVDLVNVTIEVESVTEDVSISATDRTQKKQLISGAYDLRLFRDGQLVGVSAPPEKLETFIKTAPQKIEETTEYVKRTGKLINTPEDEAWREANDLAQFEGANLDQTIKTNCIFKAGKATCVFRDIKLPHDGRKEVEFTAYAFNADKVKSTTTAPVKFTIPNSVVNSPRKGRAFVVSIGVNTSENPAYKLRYAANDARNMQKIIGKQLGDTKLGDKSNQYSEIVSIPLVSDDASKEWAAENRATKPIIRAVFSLLAGKPIEAKAVLEQIPIFINGAKTDNQKLAAANSLAVQPEDTLIITYAGHGYADGAGIFYLLPYDIGEKTNLRTAESLLKTISSDELSLWMQDITAAEMIMVIDACHSSAAVQGDGFKPGPMGSRGLGQLAYDKDMKILSATQADNVALELNSLEQGLLSYALLQDGIIKSLADADKNKQLFAAEWLSFAEKRVPELYQEVKNGKRGVILDGRNIKAGGSRAEIIDLDGNQKSSLNLQQPSLFDFKRRNAGNTLFILP